MSDSFKTRTTLEVGAAKYEIFSLPALDGRFNVARLPFSLKILLENLLRHEDGINVRAADIEALCGWSPDVEPEREIAFTPARVLMQDFTGVPAVVDLAAMRDAMAALGGDPSRINPLSPAELVIDHSVQVDVFGSADAAERNAAIEFDRNRERYEFLRWGQQAFSNFRVVPPDTGIVHQVNLEYLARTVFTRDRGGVVQAYPDTLVGTDSHTTMVNGLGVLGWGVGGIEAEAAMLGQPITMLIPQVVGFELTGRLAEGATATDLVLTVTEMLRRHGVVGKFVEYFGDGLDTMPLADRATIANMAPEYGATCGIFPIDEETLRYLRLTGRAEEQVALVESYAKAQGMWRNPGAPAAEYSAVLRLDLATVQPSLAGPKRPQDRIALSDARTTISAAVAESQKARAAKGGGSGSVPVAGSDGSQYELRDGAVVIAAITSCTNTSNPSVMIGAGLLARKARERGLAAKPWVKTSLAPGSLVVRDYLDKAGLTSSLNELGFQIVGYGCTTCIGNSGPLPEPVSAAIRAGDLAVCAILSGNRNFEGRVHPEVKMNFLASPPLVVAYAIAGTMLLDPYSEPLGRAADGTDVYLRDIWPSQREIDEVMAGAIGSGMFRQGYANVFAGDRRWSGLQVPETDRYEWRADSTYVQNPPYFTGMGAEPEAVEPIRGARVLALLGDSITTDHISPAGSIKADSPAGKYLIEQGVRPVDFNSYGSRRGNHEVMMRGTFANIRLRNRLAPGTEGGWTRLQPAGEQMSIYDASMRYQRDGIPLLVIAGKEYGTGSSRDWAAKGTRLLGVRAVIAESFERIHRSNLVGMGILPLTFRPGENAGSLGLDGSESYDIDGLVTGARELAVTAVPEGRDSIRFTVTVRIDTPKEWEYFNHGGILPYVLRQLAA
jgi:aconitate hydratase